MRADLHFHLGPVASFIGEGRRTRDFWAGSFLLSWLVGHAMRAARNRGGVDRNNIIAPVVQIELAAKARGLRFLRPWISPSGKRWRLDPILAAIEAARSGKRPPTAPFFGTLPNHFVARFSDANRAAEAGDAAARELRRAWKHLADAVRTHLLDDFLWAAPYDKQAKDIWDQQIGDENGAPFWEIYWSVEPSVESAKGDALAARKLTRLSADALAPLPMRGNFCTMFGGFVDVSGLQRITQRDQHDSFWSGVRARLNAVRYQRNDLDPDHCLDLRPNESLCAPALVKRLFPLFLALTADRRLEERLVIAIGWAPSLRNAMPVDLRTPGWWERAWAHSAAAEPIFEAESRTPEDLDKQSALLWPSTSYIAATHWIARAQGEQPALCRAFAAALGAWAHQYAVAENSLWLRAVHESGSAPLGKLDGAMLHLNRLERAEGGAVGARDAARRALLELQSAQRDPKDAATRLGAPGDHYAIVRADGDHIGEAIGKADGATKVRISRLFLRFAERLRGDARGTYRDERLGVVARRNGVLLYAGADEMLAFAPCEDALAIAEDVRAAFVAAREEIAAEACNQPFPDLTVSVAVLYCHIRAPMRWALTESLSLLDKVAKDAANRNALALGAFDIGGVRSSWAARWDTPQIRAVRTLFDRASTGEDWLWSNVFYHRLGETLGPYLAEPEILSYFQLVEAFKEDRANKKWRPSDSELISLLAAQAAREQRRGIEPDLLQTVIDAVTPWLDPELKIPHDHRPRGVATLAAFDIARLVGRNWRKTAGASR